MRKEASLDLWQELYDVTQNLRALEPWNYFWDSDIVAIELAEGEEPVFCSIMGRGGVCCGISVYEGFRGLEDFDMLATSDKDGFSPEYAMSDQNCLTCYFGDREEVSREQKEIIKNLGLKFRGRGNWIYFESFKKRYSPYLPDEREVKVLVETFENLFMSVRAVREDRIHINWDNGEIMYRRYNKEREEWNTFAVPRPITKRKYPEYKLSDEIQKARLRKKPKINCELSMDFVYMNAAIRDEAYDRPVNTLLLVIMDEISDYIIHMELIKPEEDLAEKALQFFCAFTDQNGRAKAVRYRNPWIAAALKETCRYCGIKLTKSSLRTMDKMLQMMREQMR